MRELAASPSNVKEIAEFPRIVVEVLSPRWDGALHLHFELRRYQTRADAIDHFDRRCSRVKGFGVVIKGKSPAISEMNSHIQMNVNSYPII
jgi:hypothetical protein